ncbi:MAG: alpha/beta hydrolase [Paramuribaculum sp.]|nr:alpha/beta hydrolase [Paramuribaculum sp.]
MRYGCGRGVSAVFVGLLIVAAVAAAALSSCQGTRHLSRVDNRLMRQEADSFLAGMPADLQRRQADAVRKAIEGDTEALHAVRASRNGEPEMSGNVTARMLTDRLRIYEAAGGTDTPLPALVYLHGGGWTFGSLNSCARFCDAVAASGDVKVIAVDYRLAPENPYPAGLDDCVEALRYVSRNAAALGIDPRRIAIGGDSSGGNLAVATALAPECRGMAEALVLFYPVTKAYADGSRSWADFGSGYGLDAEIMEEFNRAYLAGSDAANPAVSVALGSDVELAALPRTLLVAAGRDILCDQGREFAARLGSRATRVEFPEAVHLFITVPGQERAFRKSAELTVSFLRGER